jgi:hypothetical protein
VPRRENEKTKGADVKESKDSSLPDDGRGTAAEVDAQRAIIPGVERSDVPLQ